MKQKIKEIDTSKLTLLGNKNVKYPAKPDKKILETFSTPSSSLYYVTFDQEGEFSSLCPQTSQPDVASIRILYRPELACVESKSLKLYLFSFRNFPGFGETITNRIADDLFDVLQPYFVVVIGDFRARGGIKWKTEAIRKGCDLDEMDLIQIGKFR